MAVVTLHGQTNPVLRDYADEAHPRTFCSFGDGVFPFAILDPHHVVINYGAATAVLELPSGRAFEIGVNGFVVAVAPDFSQVLSFSYGDFAALHDMWDQGDVVIQEYPTPAGRCGGGPWPGAFSRDAKYGFAIWDQGRAATYLNVVGNHNGVFALATPPGGWPNGQQPSMGVWSPVEDKLYYNELGAIWTWTPSAGATQLRSGLLWGYPAISGDGKHIAHVVWGPNYSSATVHLMDPSSGADFGQIGAGQRFVSMFLTNDLIWMRTEGQGCGPAQPTSYIYDLRDKSESPSSLDWVSATWPATSALGG